MKIVLSVLSVLLVLSSKTGWTAEDALYYFSQGEKYRLSEEYGLAIPMYQKAIELKQDYELAYNNLGSAYYGKRMYDEAISAFKKALEINPDSKLTHNNLGCAYFYKKMYDSAIEEFKKELQNNPDYIDAINGIGYAYQQKGMYEEAINWYKQALILDPESTVARDKLEFTQKLLGEKGTRENYRTWNNLAIDMLNQNKWEEAIEYLNKAYEYASKEEKETIKGRLEEAKSNLAEKNRQEDYWQWVNSGIERINRNNLDEAIEHFNKAREYARTDEEKETVTKKIQEAKISLGEKARQENYWKLVGSGIEKVNKNNFDDAIDCFNKAMEYAKTDDEKEMVTKKIQEAKINLTEKKRQENYTKFYNAGLEMMNDNRWEKAIDYFNKGLEYALPDEKEMLKGKINEAQLALDERIRQENYWKWYSAGITAISENNLKQAMESLNKALEYTTTSAQRDKIMEKIRIARASLDRKQNWSDYQKWVDLGINQMLHQSWKNAKEIFTRAFECAPTEEEKGKIREILKEIDKRERELHSNLQIAKTSLESNLPPLKVKNDLNYLFFGPIITMFCLVLLFLFPKFNLLLAGLYLRLGKYTKAALIYEKAVFKDKKMWLYPKLAEVYMKSSRMDEKAIRVYDRAIYFNSSNPIMIKIVADYYLKHGKIGERAVEVYEEALKYEPDNIQLLHILGMIYANSNNGNGNEKKAKDIHRRLSELGYEDGEVVDGKMGELHVVNWELGKNPKYKI